MSTNEKHYRAEAVVARLKIETGITDAQARDLVELMGLDWNSLVREARMLRRAG